ncbi:MAG: hypothetical protein AABZ43_06590, partial [Planctomycetota bacterium]
MVLAGIAVTYAHIQEVEIQAADFNIPGSNTVNVNETTLNLPGTITIANAGTLVATTGMITVTGNWSNSGTFTPGNSTVEFNGISYQEINGTSTFYKLTCIRAGSNLTFEANSTQTITNTLTLRGTAGNYPESYL